MYLQSNSDDFFEVSDFVITVELPQTSDAGLHAQASLMMRLIARNLRRRGRPSADETHLALEHIPELRKFVYVQACAACGLAA